MHIVPSWDDFSVCAFWKNSSWDIAVCGCLPGDRPVMWYVGYKVIHVVIIKGRRMTSGSGKVAVCRASRKLRVQVARAYHCSKVS